MNIRCYWKRDGVLAVNFSFAIFFLYQSFLFHCLHPLRIEISSLGILFCNYFYFHISSSIRNVILIVLLRGSKHSVATFYSEFLRLRFRSKAYSLVSHCREIFWLRETRYKEVLRRLYVVKLLPFDFPRRYIVRRSIFPRTKLWSNVRITVAPGKWRARLVSSSRSIVRRIIRSFGNEVTISRWHTYTERRNGIEPIDISCRGLVSELWNSKLDAGW